MTTATIKKPAKACKTLANEADSLVRRIAGDLGASISTSEDAFTNWPWREHADRAVRILGRIGHPDSFEALEDVVDGAVGQMLQAAKMELDADLRQIEADAGRSLSGALHDGILMRHAHDYLIELIDAYDGGPSDIAKLRRLTTFEGAIGCMLPSRNDEPRLEPGLVSMIEPAARNEEFYYELVQAREVLRLAAHDNPSAPALWALCNLATLSAERAASAMEARDVRAFDVASATVQSLLDLMEELDAEANGGALFYAAQTILSVAKNGLDAEWKAVEVEAEAAHV